MKIVSIDCHRLPFSWFHQSNTHPEIIICQLIVLGHWFVLCLSQSDLSSDFQTIVIWEKTLIFRILSHLWFKLRSLESFHHPAISLYIIALQWSDMSITVSQLDCLLNRHVLNTYKFCIIGLFVNKSCGGLGFPSQRVSHSFYSVTCHQYHGLIQHDIIQSQRQKWIWKRNVTHQRHSISYPYRQGMGYPLWVYWEKSTVWIFGLFHLYSTQTWLLLSLYMFHHIPMQGHWQVLGS